MDDRSLTALEFPKILDLLAAQAATELGRGRCLALRPSRDPTWIQRRLDETEQARRLLADRGAPPFSGLTDIRQLLARSRRASGLSGHELLAVADAAAAIGRLRDYYSAGAESAPRLWAVAEPLHNYDQLVEAIHAAIDDEGEVRPDASPELQRLTRRLRELEQQLRSRLETIMRTQFERGVLSEPVIVQRAGRWCLPVRSSHRTRFHGILHDRSDTGATVFMEPAETVELGNRLRETDVAIRQEQARILAELTAQVAAVADRLARDLGTAGLLDFITAKARLADQMKANMPAIRSDGYLELRSARHPLLAGHVVANDIWLGRDFTTLVITGPNTGGKTVTLKTVGLLVLMAQAGLHIPAGPTSQVNVFDHVFADIGDEQSIEQSLSTFSSHMTQIVRILNQVGARRGDGDGVNALVLLDEIGAGTDPEEGSALARAILDELHAAGCRTIVTTHFNALKTFAYRREGMENASVEFDLRTLQPTYRLSIGHAGASKALQIAQRLGLARRVVRAARRLLGRGRREVEQVLERLDRSRRQLDREREQARELQAELERVRREHERELDRLQQERRRLAQKGYERARQIVAQAEEEAKRIIAELQSQPRQSRRTQQLRDRLAAMRTQIEQEAAAVEGGPAVQPAGLEPEGPMAELQPGTRVYVPSAGAEGILEHVSSGVASVRVGNVKLEVRAAELVPLAADQAIDEGRALAERLRARKRLTVPDEIDVRGMTVEEAIHRIDKYLDDALLAGHQRLRIIHGKGTGALRHGIHRWLADHPAVRSFALAAPDEGGDGATVVQL